MRTVEIRISNCAKFLVNIPVISISNLTQAYSIDDGISIGLYVYYSE
jgi:hypothetical protein